MQGRGTTSSAEAAIGARDLRAALGLFAAGAALRLCAASLLDALPAHFAPDEPVYRELAAALRAGIVDERLQFVSPLYPLLLAWVGSARALVVAQLALGSAIAPALYLAARRSGHDRRAGLFAGLLLVLHGPLLAFETALLPVSLGVAALAGALALEAPADGRGANSHRARIDGFRTLGVGALLALAVMCAPALLPIPLLWGALQWWRAPRAIARLLVLWLPLALALAGSAARNASLGFAASPLGANAGITFAHGNLPGAGGGYRALPGSDGSKRNQHVQARDIAERETGASLDWSAVDAFWRDHALASLAQAPLRAFGLELRKAVRFASRPFLDDELGLPAAREHWPILWALPVSFPLLLALGLIGGGSGRGLRPGSVAIALGTLSTCLVFYASDRYRLPAVVGLAGPAGVALSRWTRERGARRWIAGAALLASFAWVSLIGPSEAERRSSALRRAEAAEYGGDIPGAIEAFRSLHDEAPSLATWRGLGRTLLAAGNDEQARRLLGQARRDHPDDTRLANDHGVALLRAGRLAEAREAFEAAVAGHPPVPEGLVNLGRVLERGGHFAEAARRYAQYTRLRPAAAEGWLGLARALQAEGRDLAGATGALRRAQALAPRGAEASEATAIEALVLRDAGDRAGARERLDRLERSAASTAAWLVLAHDAERRGQLDAARRYRSRAAAARRARDHEPNQPAGAR